jgi:ferredoxin
MAHAVPRRAGDRGCMATTERDVISVLPNDGRSIRIGSKTHIWDMGLAAGIDLPALRPSAYCLTCAAKLENKEEAVNQSDSLAYFAEHRQAGYILLCTAKPRSALRIGTRRQKEMRLFRKRNGLPVPYSWSED